MLNDENFADSSFVTFVLTILFNVPEKYQHKDLGSIKLSLELSLSSQSSACTSCCIFLAWLRVIGPVGIGVEVGNVVGVVDDAGVCISLSPLPLAHRSFFSPISSSVRHVYKTASSLLPPVLPPQSRTLLARKPCALVALPWPELCVLRCPRRL
jgi:hypothetical protein